MILTQMFLVNFVVLLLEYLPETTSITCVQIVELFLDLETQ